MTTKTRESKNYSQSKITPIFPPTQMQRLIQQKLSQQLKPSLLNVNDTSGGCGTFFSIEVQSKKFNHLNTLKQHQLVKSILYEPRIISSYYEEINQVHGIQLMTLKDK